MGRKELDNSKGAGLINLGHQSDRELGVHE